MHDMLKTFSHFSSLFFCASFLPSAPDLPLFVVGGGTPATTAVAVPAFLNLVRRRLTWLGLARLGLARRQRGRLYAHP